MNQDRTNPPHDHTNPNDAADDDAMLVLATRRPAEASLDVVLEQGRNHDSIPPLTQDSIDDGIYLTITKDDPDEMRFRILRNMLVIPTALIMILYAGAFFTFGPMQLLLEQDGAFASRCDDTATAGALEEDDVCKAQSSALVTVHFIALVLLNILTPAAGYISDRFGPFMLTLALMVCACLGFILVIIASSAKQDFLLYPGFILIGFIPMFATVLIQETAKIYETSKARRIVISVLNGLFDGGGFVYLALWTVSKATGASLGHVLAVYLAIAFVLLSSILALWKYILLLHQKNNIKKTNNKNGNNNSLLQSNVPPADIATAQPLKRDALEDDEDRDENSTPTAAGDDATKSHQGTQAQRDGNKMSQPSSNHVPISHRSLRHQILSKEFILFAIFFTVHNNRNQFTLTTARYHLAYLGDDETGNRYLGIFMILTAISIAGLPIMELLIKWGGFHAALQGVNFLGIIYGTIALGSKSLDVQVVGFCVFAIYRFFIYAVSFSYLPTFVGEKVIGQMVGVVISIAGIVSFMNIPLGRWPIETLDNNFFWPNFIYTAMVIPCIFIAWLLEKGIKVDPKHCSD